MGVKWFTPCFFAVRDGVICDSVVEEKLPDPDELVEMTLDLSEDLGGSGILKYQSATKQRKIEKIVHIPSKMLYFCFYLHAWKSNTDVVEVYKLEIKEGRNEM